MVSNDPFRYGFFDLSLLALAWVSPEARLAADLLSFVGSRFGEHAFVANWRLIFSTRGSCLSALGQCGAVRSQAGEEVCGFDESLRISGEYVACAKRLILSSDRYLAELSISLLTTEV